MSTNKKWALTLQLALGTLMLLLLVWYIGAKNLALTLTEADWRFLGLALLAYLLMNLLFAYRMKYVLKTLGRNVTFTQALTAQYGGMLASDFTPARSGYLIVPVILNGFNVPLESGFSTVLGCQSVEFMIKMVTGLLAILYLIYKASITQELILTLGLGVALMFLGGLILALTMWSKHVFKLLTSLQTKPVIGKPLKLLLRKASPFQAESQKVKPAIPVITALTLTSWMVKGLEWYFIGLALKIFQVDFIGFLLLHPLVTALSFVPLTPSGLGFQEGAVVGVLYLLGVSLEPSLAFALLARLLLVLEDAVGVFPLSKTGIKILEYMTQPLKIPGLTEETPTPEKP